MSTIHVTKADQGEHLLVGGDLMTIKASSDDTSGTMLVFETGVAPGGGPPALHRHAYAETFVFLAGEFEVSTLDDNRVKTYILGQGDTLSVPSMVWHNFKNIGATPGKLLAIHSPPVMEPLLREVGVAVDDPNQLPTPSGPPSPEQIERFMRVIGRVIEMLPPDAVTR